MTTTTTTTVPGLRVLTLVLAFTTALGSGLVSATATAIAPVSAASNATATNTISCPQACSCSVVARKNVTICQERGLSSIPLGIAKRTHFLDVSGNRIATVRDREFWSLDLLSLETITLSSSGVAEVRKYAFAGLKWLKELDLSNNSIVGLDPLVFADNKLLEMVNLSGNPISTLVSFQFTALPMLKQLDLRNCALRVVQPEAFSNLLFLESLNLRNNSLATLPKDLFTWLRYLDELDLHENPWRCDCDVQSLLILLSIRRLYTRDLSCTYEADNKTNLWQHMQNVDLDCIPGIESSVKENLFSLSERLRQTPAASTSASTSDVTNTGKALFSSQRVETSLLPIALAAVAATVCFLSLVSCYAKCRSRRPNSSSYSQRHGGCSFFNFQSWRSKNVDDDDDDDDFEKTCYSNFDEDCSDISLTVEL